MSASERLVSFLYAVKPLDEAWWDKAASEAMINTFYLAIRPYDSRTHPHAAAGSLRLEYANRYARALGLYVMGDPLSAANEMKSIGEDLEDMW